MFRRYLTEGEQRLLLEAIEQYAAAAAARRDGWVIRLLLHTGMRLGETLAMTCGDAMSALATRYIFIPAARRKGGKQEHSVLVTEPVRRALAALLQIAAEEVDGESIERERPLITARGGKRLSARALQLRVRGWAQLAGIKGDVSPHWFRHTRAMAIMRRSQAEDPRGIAQAALGHASLSSTAIYTQPTKEDVEQALHTVDGPLRLRKRDVARYLAGRR